eukprot:TRINITY_DN10234_c0_g1_i1.p1 TRINITY_DN10234_c0_g1~~TRINITY_DN10234_c0_g1_i1.p1  ORF type:complete len:153 (-),score=27.98 TRINITY_DN10234_c0_g1_i1:340-798(-)
MPRRSDSRSDSRRRRDSRSRSRGRGRDRYDDRRRGGGNDRRGGGGRGRGRDIDLAAYGTSGKVVDIKATGFGFIRPDAGQVNEKDLYFHSSAVNRKISFDDLQMNDEVTYEVVIDERKGQPTAKNVTLKDGGGGGKRGRSDSRDASKSRGRR